MAAATLIERRLGSFGIVFAHVLRRYNLLRGAAAGTAAHVACALLLHRMPAALAVACLAAASLT